MTTNKKAYGTLWTTTLIAIAVLLMTACLWRLLKPDQTNHLKLSITGGSSSGLRHSIAETLAEIASRNGVDISVVPTNGSVDAMHRVENGTLNFALVQGGLGHSSYSKLKQAAVLHVEPLHVLIKTGSEEAPDHLTIETVGRMMRAGKQPTINLSKPGSGTNLIARDLLQFFDLQESIDYFPMEQGYDYFLSPDRTTEELPGVVFTVSSLPSPMAKHLIHKHGFRPMELKVANAYRLDWTAQIEGNSINVIRRKIVPAFIPAFTYQINPPVPSDPVETIGTRLQLIASTSTPPAAVEELLSVIYETTFATTADPPLTLELLQTSAEFDLHAGAANYLERKTPVITEKLVEVTEQVLAILGTLAGAVLFAWQAMSFVRRRRRDRQFLQCVSRVGEIEHRAMEFETNDAMTVDDLVRLQAELNQIKSDMIRQFQSGDIDGADTLSGFLMHVNDANENLTRMILHERQPRPAV